MAITIYYNSKSKPINDLGTLNKINIKEGSETRVPIHLPFELSDTLRPLDKEVYNKGDNGENGHRI